MAKRFRNSEFIDFNSGTVKIAPIQLQFRMTLAGPLQYADLVRLFCCRVEVWHLGVAVQMLHDIEFNSPPSVWSHAAYGIVALLFNYFETIGRIINPKPVGQHATEMDFDFGFRDVYNDIRTSDGTEYDPIQFYNRARNGLFYLGSTPHGLWVHNERSISVKDFDIIQKNLADPASRKYYVNPHSATRTIVDHFPTFIERLIDSDPDNEAMRVRFREFIGGLRDS